MLYDRNKLLSKFYIERRCIKIRLTAEQRKIAEDNHNLIYSFLHQYNLDIDEWYDVAAIGYCKAVATFNANKGAALSTYLYYCMLNEVRTLKRKKNHKTISLDVSFEDGLHIIDSIADKADIADEVRVSIDTYNIYTNLYQREKKILHMRLNGASQREIAKKLNISQAHVSRIESQLKLQISYN